MKVEQDEVIRVHLSLQEIFRVTLVRSEPLEELGYRVVSQTRKMLEEQKKPLLLDLDCIQVMLDELSKDLGSLPFLEYLYDCHNRCKKYASMNVYWVNQLHKQMFSAVLDEHERAKKKSGGRDDLICIFLQSFHYKEELHLFLKDFVAVLQEIRTPLNLMFIGSFEAANFMVRRLHLLDDFKMPFNVVSNMLKGNYKEILLQYSN